MAVDAKLNNNSFISPIAPVVISVDSATFQKIVNGEMTLLELARVLQRRDERLKHEVNAVPTLARE